MIDLNWIFCIIQILNLDLFNLHTISVTEEKGIFSSLLYQWLYQRWKAGGFIQDVLKMSIGEESNHWQVGFYKI